MNPACTFVCFYLLPYISSDENTKTDLYDRKSDICWPPKMYVVWCMWWNACLLEDKGNCLFGISGLDSVVCFEIHGNARSPIRIDKNPQFNVSSLQFLRRSAIDCMECWTLTITNTKNVKLVWPSYGALSAWLCFYYLFGVISSPSDLISAFQGRARVGLFSVSFE